MSARLHLCGTDAMARLEPMIAAAHAEAGIASDADHRAAAIGPLLEGAPYGAVYLIGPERAPVGYLVVTFTWSTLAGGMEGRLEELWIRPAVRRRGMASEAVQALASTLAEAGLCTLSAEAENGSDAARLHGRLGFRAQAGVLVMRRPLA